VEVAVSIDFFMSVNYSYSILIIILTFQGGTLPKGETIPPA
jgi:hypothetical protein